MINITGRIFLFTLCFFTIFFLAAQDDSSSLKALRTKAENGDVQAQFELGNSYFYGSENVRKNPVLAAYWFKKAADEGLAEAEFNYAWCLENGSGVEKNEGNALEYYGRAASKGIKEAAFILAMIRMRGIEGALEPSAAEAKSVLEGLSKDGYAPAKGELAALYLAEKNNIHADELAFELLREAVESKTDYAKVYRLFADCYYSGRGTLPDPEKAVPYLEKASELGDIESIVKLAYILERGLPRVPVNRKRAIEYYRVAASKDNPEALCRIADFIVAGDEKGTSQDAEKLYEKAASFGHPRAQYKFAVMLLEHENEPDDIRRGTELLMQSARGGNPDGQYELAKLFHGEKKILKVNDEMAFFWLTEAARRDHAAAQRELAICYFNGKGCVKDDAKGGEMLRMASKNGDVIATQMLSRNSRSPW